MSKQYLTKKLNKLTETEIKEFSLDKEISSFSTG